MKRLFLRLFLVAVVVGLVLAASEWGVRAFLNEGLEPDLLQPEAGKAYFGARMLESVEEEGVRYAGRPGASVTIRDVLYSHDERLGARVAPASIDKPAGTYRIVVVGDSNAYGWGVPAEATFPHLVAEELREAGMAVDVCVLAYPGYNTADQAALLARHGEALAPDLVLVAWFVNDRERLGFHVDTEGWLFADPLPIPDAWKPTLWRSYLYRRFSVNEVSRMRKSGEYVAGEGENLEFAEEKLLELAGIARGLGAKVAVLDVPVLEPSAPPAASRANAGVSSTAKDDTPAALEIRREGYVAAEGSRWLTQVCGRYGLPRKDLLDAVEGVPAPLLWASPETKDHHPNADAHARFARAIVPWLREQGFVPTE